MSTTGGGRDDETRDDAADAAVETPGERVAPGTQDAAAEQGDQVQPGEPVTDASSASPADESAARGGDTAVYDSPLIEPAADEPAAPAGATTRPAEPGPVGPGDTAIVEPAVVRPSGPPTSVEPPVGTGSPTGAEAADDDVPPYVPGEAYPGTSAAAASTAEPGAPVDDEPADTQSRLDAAVQRANAVPVTSERTVDETSDTPEPVPADSVRRETYVPPAAAGAAAGAGAASLAPEASPPQTVYVQAPTPPKAKSNRGFGVLVALIGTAVFAALYAGVTYLMFFGQAGADASDLFMQFLTRPIFYVPIIAMFVGFALLVVIVNRGAWWMYAVFGLLVGVFVYFSYIGAALLTVSAWELTQQQAVDFVNGRWLDPFAIAAGVIAREIPIWLGGWIAKRGRGVAERNRLAMEAYDRELAAGPRPVAR
jgi:hypothetical protein